MLNHLIPLYLPPFFLGYFPVYPDTIVCEPYKVPAPIDILGNLAPIAVNATFCPTNNNAFPVLAPCCTCSPKALMLVGYSFLPKIIFRPALVKSDTSNAGSNNVFKTAVPADLPVYSMKLRCCSLKTIR